MRAVGTIFKIKFAALFLLISTGVLATDRDMYLATAGPTPLRFQWDLPQLDPARLLPALPMSDAGAATNASAAVVPQSAPEAQKPTTTSNEAQEVTTDANGNVDMTALEPGMPANNNEGISQQNVAHQISPQVLLRYFSRNGTNEVLVPYSVDFTPPVPSRTGDSSATYISK
jgi:hypothetical protein